MEFQKNAPPVPDWIKAQLPPGVDENVKKNLPIKTNIRQNLLHDRWMTLLKADNDIIYGKLLET